MDEETQKSVDEYFQKNHPNGLNYQSSPEAAPKPPAAPEAPSTSAKPVIELAKNAKDKLDSFIPEALSPFIAPALGVGAGMVARKIIPQSIQFNPEANATGMETIREANTRLGRIPEDLEAQRQVHAERGAQLQSELAEANAAHAQTTRNLENNLQSAKDTHDYHSSNVAQAESEHAFAHARDAAYELEAEKLAQGKGPATTTPKQIELTPRPTGGPAVEKYALEFGTSPGQALEAESMSNVQKKVIPKNVSGAQTTRNIAPEFRNVKESILSLTESGLDAVRKTLDKEQKIVSAEELRVKQEEKRLEELKREIREHKAHSTVNLSAAKREEQKAAEALKEHKKALKEHVKAIPNMAKEMQSHAEKSPTTPVQRQRELEDAKRLAEEKVWKTKSKYLRPLEWLGKQGARFLPTVGAAFAPLEFEQAKKEREAGNYIRSPIHQLGGYGALLQATNIAPLMGAGDLMQIPSLGLAAYDTTKDYLKEEPKQ